MKYIIFLVDADKLFDTALGMYDFSLVLMIAQHAQRVHAFPTPLLYQCVDCVLLGPKGVPSIPPGAPGTRSPLPTIPDRRPPEAV